MAEIPIVATAFYHDPPIWVGVSLVPSAAAKIGDIDFKSFRRLAVDKTLPCGIRLAVSQEGMFMFSFDNWPPCDTNTVAQGDFDGLAAAALRQTQVMNTYLAILYTKEQALSGIARQRMVVAPSARIPMRDPEGAGLTSSKLSWGSQDLRAMDLSLSSFPTLPPFAMAAQDRRLTGRAVFAVQAVEEAADVLSSYLSAHPDDGALLADMFQRAVVYYTEHNNPAALLSFWPVTERLLFELEAQHLQTKAANSHGAIQALLNAGVIDLATYALLDRARRARNRWTHGLDQSIDAEDAMSAGLACRSLLVQARSLELECRAGRQIAS